MAEHVLCVIDAAGSIEYIWHPEVPDSFVRRINPHSPFSAQLAELFNPAQEFYLTDERDYAGFPIYRPHA